MRQTRAGNPEKLIRHALWLEIATVSWNVIEAVVAITAGWLAGSIALIGFGLDSVIEVTAASILIWRLRCELACRHATHAGQEWVALRVVGVTFFLLAAYVAFEAGSMLWARKAPQISPIGMGLAACSGLLMPFLGFRKRRLAKQVGSRALAADAMETLMCAYLSITLLVGLGLNALWGWWWADPVAALAMLPLMLREGWEALTEPRSDAEPPA